MLRRTLNIISILAVTGAAMLSGPSPAQDTTQPREPKSYGYGNWTIREDLTNNGYVLIGQSSDDKQGQLWLQCDQKGTLTLLVPMFGRPTSESWQRSQIVNVRSDDFAPRQFGLIVFQNFVAMATKTEQERTGDVTAFMSAVGAAKRTFVLSFDQTSYEFDVAQLPAARTRFAELCNRIASR